MRGRACLFLLCYASLCLPRSSALRWRKQNFSPEYTQRNSLLQTTGSTSNIKLDINTSASNTSQELTSVLDKIKEINKNNSTNVLQDETTAKTVKNVLESLSNMSETISVVENPEKTNELASLVSKAKDIVSGKNSTVICENCLPRDVFDALQQQFLFNELDVKICTEKCQIDSNKLSMLAYSIGKQYGESSALSEFLKQNQQRSEKSALQSNVQNMEEFNKKIDTAIRVALEKQRSMFDTEAELTRKAAENRLQIQREIRAEVEREYSEKKKVLAIEMEKVAAEKKRVEEMKTQQQNIINVISKLLESKNVKT